MIMMMTMTYGGLWSSLPDSPLIYTDSVYFSFIGGSLHQLQMTSLEFRFVYVYGFLNTGMAVILYVFYDL